MSMYVITYILIAESMYVFYVRFADYGDHFLKQADPGGRAV
jgi:hypothetical protein